MEIGHCHRIAFIQPHIPQSFADGISLVQIQALHHFGYQRGRFQGEQLVIDVGIRPEDTQVGKFAHAVSGRTALGIVLHQNGCGTGIDVRSAQQVKGRYG